MSRLPFGRLPHEGPLSLCQTAEAALQAVIKRSGMAAATALHICVISMGLAGA